MSVRIDAEHDSYDVVVVGSGLGGLTAGALLAQAGQRVLVVERHDRLGGYAHAFTRRKHRFDSAVHLIAGGEPVVAGNPGLLSMLLDRLGVGDQCEFRRLDPFYRAVFPGFQLDLPTGPDFLDAHVAAFPAERAGLRRLQRLCTRLTREVMRTPPDLPTDELLDHDLPLLHEYHKATVADVFDRHLHDPRLKALLSALWPYLGLPPSRAAFDMWAPMLMNYVDLGVYYCVGSFQRLVDAVGAALTRHGGEALLRTAVRRISVVGGRVTGVVLDNGQRITAPVVISNADPVQTCAELVGAEHVEGGYLTRLRALRPSLSAAVLFLATDLDLAAGAVAHETFLYDHWDHDETYRRMLAGEVPGLVVTVPTLSDPSLAPAGQHLITLATLLPYEAAANWRQSKPHYERLMLAKLDTLIPGIRERVTMAEGGTPRTMERYTLNLRGAIYGWEQTPDQSTTDRLPHRTPVDGLYLSGHWTQPGGGVLTAMSSGVQTVELVTGSAVFGPPPPVRIRAETASGQRGWTG
jgi:phytoene desaturase